MKRKIQMIAKQNQKSNQVTTEELQQAISEPKVQESLKEVAQPQNLENLIPIEVNSGQQSTSDGSHLDSIKVDNAIDTGIDVLSSGGEISHDPKLLTKDQFYTAFEGLFKFGGMFSGLKSLQIAEGEKADARATSDVFYDMALELPWLRFLIEPTSIWTQRILVVGTFGFMKYQAVIVEISARKKEAVKNEEKGIQ